MRPSDQIYTVFRNAVLPYSDVDATLHALVSTFYNEVVYCILFNSSFVSYVDGNMVIFVCVLFPLATYA